MAAVSYPHFRTACGIGPVGCPQKRSSASGPTTPKTPSHDFLTGRRSLTPTIQKARTKTNDGMSSRPRSIASCTKRNSHSAEYWRLHRAITQKDSNEARNALLSGADASAPHAIGITPLHKAAFAGDIEMCRTLLLAKDATVDVKDHLGQVPLHVASGQLNQEIVVLLLAKSAQPYISDNEGVTPVRMAVARAQYSDVDVRALIVILDAIARVYEYHIDTLRRRNEVLSGRTGGKEANDLSSLTICSNSRSTRLSKSPVEEVPKDPDFDAVRRERDFVNSVVSRSERPDARPVSAGNLHGGRENGEPNPDSIARLHSKGKRSPLLRRGEFYPSTCMMAASLERSLQAVNLCPTVGTLDTNVMVAPAVGDGTLLNRPATMMGVEKLDDDWAGMAHNALVAGHIPEGGADAMFRRAAWHGKLDLVQFLLDFRADISGVDDEGRSALHYAAVGGQPGTVKMLVRSRADSVRTDKRGLTPLRFAILELKTMDATQKADIRRLSLSVSPLLKAQEEQINHFRMLVAVKEQSLADGARETRAAIPKLPEHTNPELKHCDNTTKNLTSMSCEGNVQGAVSNDSAEVVDPLCLDIRVGIARSGTPQNSHCW